METLGHVSYQYLKVDEMEYAILLVVKREAIPQPKMATRSPAQAGRKPVMKRDVEA
jgi:hypothetical protein